MSDQNPNMSLGMNTTGQMMGGPMGHFSPTGEQNQYN